MNENQIRLEFDAFLRSFEQNTDGSFSFLLGAGASITSGIQSATDCLWDWKKKIYVSKNPSDETFLDIHVDSCKQIIQSWIDSQRRYPSLGAINEYEFFAEATYPMEHDRTKYFESLSYGKEPNIGYKLLCLLNKYDVVKSIWSTNFDGLVPIAAYKASLRPIEVNLSNSELAFKNESKNELLYIALHGDYKYGKLKNTSFELDNQNENFVSRLKSYFIDKNLIVIGYSGRDNSLMTALEQAFSNKGEGRLYWCGYGDKIPEPVLDLLIKVRNSGREARYISTNGFDNTMCSLLLSTYRDDDAKKEEIYKIIQNGERNEETKPFVFERFYSSGCIKTNLYPVAFPKDLYQFSINYSKDCSEWKFIKDKIKKFHDIVAVPYNGNVFSFSCAETIHSAFHDVMTKPLTRTPITVDHIFKNSTLKSLFLKTILCGISSKTKLNISLSKSIIWDKTKPYNGYKDIHEGLKVSLIYRERIKYPLISMSPTLYFENKETYPKEYCQNLIREYLDKKRNKIYEQILQYWENLIFKGCKLQFDYPINRNNQFIFRISNNRVFVEIDYTEKSVIPEHQYHNAHKLLNGIFINEPELNFTSKITKKIVQDSNSMRGLKNNLPFDYSFGSKYNNHVDIGVICPVSYNTVFKDFLQGLNGEIGNSSTNSSDYIQDYTGFSQIYSCPINIPAINSPEWVNCRDDQTDPILLAQNICKQAQIIATKIPGITVVIFIPKKWERLKRIEKNGVIFDLHNYIKAFAAQSLFTTQFIEEKTICDIRMRREIYWWLSLALFAKSMRTPWVLSNLENSTAYAGIGYSLKDNGNGSKSVLVGCSHIYNSKGQGLRYKLAHVDNPLFDDKRNPYLSYEEAFKFGINIQELFIRSMETLPNRVVIHKRTPFQDSEIKGIVDALGQAKISNIDLISIAIEDHIRCIDQEIMNMENAICANYPVHRGICIPISDNEFLLWTHGTVPSVIKGRNFYPGGRGIPAPLRVTKYYGNGDMMTIAKEILGFTKMNWNSFNYYTKFPATIETSNTLAQIGDLLTHTNGETFDYRYFI